MNAIFEHLRDSNVDCKINKYNEVEIVDRCTHDQFTWVCSEYHVLKPRRRCLIGMLVNGEIAIHIANQNREQIGSSQHTLPSMITLSLADPQLLDKILTHVDILDTGVG